MNGRSAVPTACRDVRFFSIGLDLEKWLGTEELHVGSHAACALVCDELPELRQPAQQVQWATAAVEGARGNGRVTAGRRISVGKKIELR